MSTDTPTIRPTIPHGTWQRLAALDRVLLQRAGCRPPDDEDGPTATGGEWTRPQDYQDDDVAAGRLPCLKGSTPTELPTLDTPDGG